MQGINSYIKTTPIPILIPIPKVEFMQVLHVKVKVTIERKNEKCQAS